MNRALATLPDISSATDFSASAAKAKLGEVIDLVAAGGLATITRRGRQRFAVLKLETVEALVAAAREQELESLGNRYDELVARMQSPEAQGAVDSLFTASGDEIGAAATVSAEQSVPPEHRASAKQRASAEQRVPTKQNVPSEQNMPAEQSAPARRRTPRTKTAAR